MNILVITYWSYSEPLIQAYTMPYVRTIKKQVGTKGRVYLVTLEKPSLKIDKKQKRKLKQALKEEGIHWITGNYYSFGIRTILSFVPLLFYLTYVILLNRISVIHTWCTPAGALGWFLSVITRRKLVIDSYEPHALSMIENGTWKQRGLPFKILFKLEKLQTKRAVACIGLTNKTQEYAQRYYGFTNAIFYSKPAAVDEEAFNPKIPKDYSLIDEPTDCSKVVCIYAGKIGGIYLEKEIFDFFKTCVEYWNGNFKAIILTNSNEGLINRLAIDSRLESIYFWSGYAPHYDVQKYMVLADFALNPVKPVPSKRYCTSIKDGEYWAMGLPVVITKNISDDSSIIEANNIGAVIETLDEKGYIAALTKIDQLLSEIPHDVLTEKIRNIAISFRSFNQSHDIYHSLYNCQTGLLRFKKIKSETNSPIPSIVYCFQSLKDPLVDGLILSYLKELGETQQIRVYLITLEQKPYKLQTFEINNVKSDLRALGIQWLPFTYHSGKFLLLKKSWDFLRVAFLIFRLRITAHTKHIIGFLPIAGAYAAILGRFLFMKSFTYCFEPHSMYLTDLDTWQEKSVKTKLLRYFEKFQVRHAKEIVVPTSHTLELVKPWKPKGKVTILPISVDTELFKPLRNHIHTMALRQNFGFENHHTVFIYAGKLGGLYYSPEEMALFVSELQKNDDQFRLLMITNNNTDEIKQIFNQAGIAEHVCVILPSVPYHDLPYYISAADIGMLAIPPRPSQKYRTPVKTGLYLACGIPYLTCESVAEDDVIALEEHIGVVIPTMTPEFGRYALQKTKDLLADSKTKERCRIYATTHRSSKLTKEVLSNMLLIK